MHAHIKKIVLGSWYQVLAMAANSLDLSLIVNLRNIMKRKISLMKINTNWSSERSNNDIDQKQIFQQQLIHISYLVSFCVQWKKNPYFKIIKIISLNFGCGFQAFNKTF